MNGREARHGLIYFVQLIYYITDELNKFWETFFISTIFEFLCPGLSQLKTYSGLLKMTRFAILYSSLVIYHIVTYTILARQIKSRLLIPSITKHFRQV